MASTHTTFWLGRDDTLRVPAATDRLGAAEQVLAVAKAPPPEALALPVVPTLDDVLAAWLSTTDARERFGPETLRALAVYARAGRQGVTPGDTPLHHAPRGVFEEIRRRHQAAADGDCTAFVHDAFALFEHVAARQEAGTDISSAAVFAASSEFDEHIAVLERDEALWREDRSRSRGFLGRIDGREVGLLALDLPRSVGFVDWARDDRSAPGGVGWAVLLVRRADGALVLSSDPTRRLPIAEAAALLDRAERTARGGDLPEPWYDGQRHRGTVVASPHIGTRLDLDGVLRALRPAWHLRPLRRTATSAPRAVVAAVVTLLVVAVALPFGLRTLREVPPDEPMRRDFVQPAAPRAEEPVLPPSGALYRKRVALVIGIDRYADATWRPLPNAVRDARAVADALGAWGFEARLLTVAEHNTSAELQDVITETIEALTPKDALVVYWAGHGFTRRDTASQGYLAAYDTEGDNPGHAVQMKWLEETMADLSTDELGPRDRLLVLDTCRSGILIDGVIAPEDRPASRGSGDEWVRRQAALRSFQTLTSGGGRQDVSDGTRTSGNSPFARAFVEVLEATPSPSPFSSIEGRIRKLAFEYARDEWGDDPAADVQQPRHRFVRGAGDLVLER